MKKNLVYILVTVSFLLCSCSVKDGGYTADRCMALTDGNPPEAPAFFENDDGKFELISENKEVGLYINADNAGIAVQEKAGGKLWYSNAEDRAKDERATGSAKSLLNAQFTIQYTTSTYVEGKMNSYDDCVKEKQFEIVRIPGGVKVIFTVGGGQRTDKDLPPKIRKSVYNGLLKKMNGDQTRILNKCYTYNSMSDCYLRGTSLLTSDVQKLFEIFGQTGFTEQDIEEEFIAAKEEKQDAKPSFVIPFEYTIHNNSFSLKLLSGEIKCPAKIKIKSITLMENFGSGRLGSEGYMMIPDGSGSIAYFNRHSQSYYENISSFSAPVYGQDQLLLKEEGAAAGQKVGLPMFAVGHEDGAFICTVENGAALMSVHGSGPKLSSYYNAYFEYSPYKYDVISYSNVMVKKYNQSMFTEQPVLKYIFYSGKQTYSQLAREYRAYLDEKGLLPQNRTESEYNVFLTVLGEFETEEHFLLFKNTAANAATTYEQAKDLIALAKSAGAQKVNVIYKGAVNGAAGNRFVENLSFNKKLGTKMQWDALNRYAEENNAAIFPQFNTLRIFDTTGFSKGKNSAVYLSGTAVKIPEINLSTGGPEETGGYYLLNPKEFPRVFGAFEKALKKKKINRIALSDAANLVYSSGNDKSLYNVSEMIGAVAGSLEQLSKNHVLMVSNPSLYGLKYASVISDISLGNSENRFFDAAVPFLQMVVRNAAEYTAEPLTLSDGKRLLQYIETGTALNFFAAYQNRELLKDSLSQGLYLSDIDAVQKKMSDVLNRTKGYYQAIAGEDIAGHSILENGLRVTEYGNGVTAVINNTGCGLDYNGINVEANDFLLLDGGGREL